MIAANDDPPPFDPKEGYRREEKHKECHHCRNSTAEYCCRVSTGSRALTAVARGASIRVGDIRRPSRAFDSGVQSPIAAVLDGKVLRQSALAACTDFDAVVAAAGGVRDDSFEEGIIAASPGVCPVVDC